MIRIDIDKDLQGWRPKKGQKDKNGNEIEDRIDNFKDMIKNLSLKHGLNRLLKKLQII